MVLASSSTSKFRIPSCFSRANPSLMAQHSTIALVTTLIDLENLFIHFLELSLMTPPPPALPVTPYLCLALASPLEVLSI